LLISTLGSADVVQDFIHCHHFTEIIYPILFVPVEDYSTSEHFSFKISSKTFSFCYQISSLSISASLSLHESPSLEMMASQAPLHLIQEEPKTVTKPRFHLPLTNDKVTSSLISPENGKSQVRSPDLTV